MNAISQLLQQRSIGEITFRMDRDGPSRLRESGSAKLRIPKSSHHAILINTGGGIAGGDQFRYNISTGSNARLSLTTQAAERVYRTLGPTAVVDTNLQLDAESELFWLPQETILFNCAALQRNYTVSLAPSARFLAVEPVILGRREMGEDVTHITLNDRWRIERNGQLLHADNLIFGGEPNHSNASLGSARAFATLLFIADNAAQYLDSVRAAIGPAGGASAWNGKLVARLVAQDGFHLRKRLIPALYAIIGADNLPKPWTF